MCFQTCGRSFFLEKFADSNLFDTIDLMIANLMLPLNGLLIVLFAGWALKREALIREFTPSAIFPIWQLAVRFIVPAGVIAVLLSI